MKKIALFVFLLGCGKSEDAIMERMSENEAKMNRLQDRLNEQQRKINEVDNQVKELDEEIGRMGDLLEAYAEKADQAFNAIQLKLEEQSKAKRKKK
jgi:archaellum component FlaC